MSKITESAINEQCLVRIEGVCNFDSSTTVFAHVGGGGMGTKRPDTEGAYCCSSCHDELDGRTRKYQPDQYYRTPVLKLYHHEGAMRTRKKLIDKGLILIAE